MTKPFRLRRPLTTSLLACCLLGLLAGCNSSGTTEGTPGQVSPRFKKIEDAKSKVDAAKK